MQRLTQDNFIPGYSNANHDDFPKLVYWTLEAPIIYNGISINANILQRKMDEYSEWEYIPSIKMASQELGSGDSTYLMDLDDADVEITLQEAFSFDDAINIIYQKVDDIRYDYSAAKPREYDAGDDDWTGWIDYGDQYDLQAARKEQILEERRREEQRHKIAQDQLDYEDLMSFF